MNRNHDLAGWLAGAVLLVCLLAGSAVVGVLAARVAHGHEAPSGWEYDIGCCSNQDCAELRADAVRETPDGYILTVGPKDNNQLLREHVIEIRHGDHRLRKSKDEFNHACFSREYKTKAGYEGGRLLCFYEQMRGF